MKSKHILFSILSISVLIMFSSCKTSVSDNVSNYQYKFKNKDEFVNWLNKNGHKAKFISGKYYTMVLAVDGGEFEIDGKTFECYLYDSKEKWDQLPKILADFDEVAKDFGDTSKSQLINYYNVRCFQN